MCVCVCVMQQNPTSNGTERKRFHMVLYSLETVQMSLKCHFPQLRTLKAFLQEKEMIPSDVT